MSDLWLPGASGSVDDLVARVQLRIEAFAERTGNPPVVEVELRECPVGGREHAEVAALDPERSQRLTERAGRPGVGATQ